MLQVVYQYLVHILPPATGNCPYWISDRGIGGEEMISWLIYTEVMWLMNPISTVRCAINCTLKTGIKHKGSTLITNIQLTLIISTSLISNNCLSRSKNLVPILTTGNKILWKRGEIAPKSNFSSFPQYFQCTWLSLSQTLMTQTTS